MSYQDKLQTEKKQVKIICDYLLEQCKVDDKLCECIISKEYNTVDKMFTYIKDQAQKEAEDGCAMIPDATVYKWSIDYWLDITETKPKPPKKTKDDEENEEEEQALGEGMFEGEEIDPEEYKAPKPMKEKKVKTTQVEKAQEIITEQLSLFDF